MGIALHFLRTALSIIRIIFHFKENLYSAVPERIYNSHYGNGVPAMFTS